MILHRGVNLSVLVVVPMLSLLMSDPITAASPARVRPAALRPGATIMFVAPAGPLIRSRVELARKRLEARGFHVLVPRTLFRRRGYLAGSDQQRAAELMAAFTNPNVDAVFPCGGGYGVTRILDRLDYDAIQRQPKIVIGFSDITGLHLALAAKTNLVTFHSPNPQWGLGSQHNMATYTARYFWRNLLAKENQGRRGFHYEAPSKEAAMAALRPGTARGPLIGGNLSLIIATMGTPYEIDTRGKVFFFEDTNEEPYRIDRYLSQLKLAGKLAAPAAVLVGQFTKAEPDKGKPSLTLGQVLNDYFGAATYPVVTNFPVGHVKNNATLPLGMPTAVDASAARVLVRVLDNPVEP